MARISLARSLHDLGLAGWFGGSLMGAVGLNAAAGVATEPDQRPVIASAGWARWAPVNAAFIGAHLLGGALIVRENRGRIKAQKGVASWTTTKTLLTGAALAATAASGRAGAKVAAAGRFPADAGASPSGQTPADLAAAQKQLAALQWAIPALTGAIVSASATMGEQQRPAEILKGSLKRAGTSAKVAASNPKETGKALRAAV